MDNEVDRVDKIRNTRKKNIKLGEILRLSQRGLSCREVGRIVGCSKQSISKRLRDWEKSKLKSNK